MQYIFPAADAALELQEAIHGYLKKFDNPLIHQAAVQIGENNKREHLVARAKSLRARVQHLQFCLEVLSRKVVFDRNHRDWVKAELTSKLWDSLLGYDKLSDERMNQCPQLELEAYLQNGTAAVALVERHIRVSPETARRLGMTPAESDEAIFKLGDCQRIISALVQDEVDTQMRWRPMGDDQSNIEQVLTALFPDWDGKDETRAQHLPPEHQLVWREQAEKCSTHFYRHVIEQTMLKISRWVHSTIPYRTWDVWYVKPLGRDLVLEQGDDYRIVDWERRMKTGEWSTTSTLAQDLEDTVEVSAQCENEIAASQARFERETEAGFSPRMFHAHLTERPMPELIKAGAPTPIKPSRNSRG